ncbi:protein kinase [Perkinsela sp. CCAP 1560/4]|nr:protein kinase [Perkinsela sp. CCAP 1560/4]|eukprot:KNH01744.1 protein kinase [Perkinsela sp. CCAP 1560/4]
MEQKNPLRKPHPNQPTQVALVPTQRALRNKAPFEAIKDRIRQASFHMSERFQSMTGNFKSEERRFALTQPYYFCPLCHHQFSYAQAQDSHRARVVYPQSTYFRNLSAQNADDESASRSYYKTYFIEIRKLSRGSFGSVYVCQHVMNGVPLGIFAVKKIPVGDDTKYLSKVLKEVRILEDMTKHPNVVEYNHSWIDKAKTVDFGPSTRCLFILMEFATEGSLDEYLCRQGHGLSNILVWYFFLSAIAGVNHLHSQNVLHCDLKPQNLLLTSGHDGVLPRLMVGDFGASCMDMSGASQGSGCTGTEDYMAPELFDMKDGVMQHTYRYTWQADMWSLGMVLHFLMSGGELARYDRLTGKVTLHHSAYVRPVEMIAIVKALLSQDPTTRPSCQDILTSDTVGKLREDVMNNRSSFRESCQSPVSFEFTSPVHRDTHESTSSLPSPSLKAQIDYGDKVSWQLDSDASTEPSTSPHYSTAIFRVYAYLLEIALRVVSFQLQISLGTLFIMLGIVILYVKKG